MLVGYARTSTLEQEHGLAHQIEALESLGCERVFSEQRSSVEDRPSLSQALDFVRDGDTLVVLKLDRLARSVRHMGEIIESLEQKAVALRVVDMNIDTGNASGKLIFNVMSSIAQFERELMLERQREGIQRAKALGKYKGRAPTARAKSDEVKELHRLGIGKSEIATRLGIGRTSVYRILGQAA